jgi:hypothetical protein
MGANVACVYAPVYYNSYHEERRLTMHLFNKLHEGNFFEEYLTTVAFSI